MLRVAIALGMLTVLTLVNMGIVYKSRSDLGELQTLQQQDAQRISAIEDALGIEPPEQSTD